MRIGFVLWVALVAGVVVADGAVDAALTAPRIGWGDTLVGALDVSRETRRPVMVDVWAVWCAPCKEMEHTTYADPTVVALANEGFVPLKVDADVHDSFTTRYGIDAFPTLLVLDHEGTEISRMEGFVASDDLLARMRPIATGYGDYLQAAADASSAAALTSAAGYLVAADNPEGAVRLLKQGARGLKKGPAEELRQVELYLGIAQLAAGDDRAAAKTLRKLDTAEAGDWLARCGREDGPAAAVQRLSGNR